MEKLSVLAKSIDLSANDAWAVTSGGGGLDLFEFEINPYDFLMRAEDDYDLGGDAASLNALTNAKRAITGQMDQALLSFGYPATRWDIPKKLAVLDQLGFMVPRVLRKVSSVRNLLEHEYRRPDNIQVEEALDLAALFLASIRPRLQLFPDEFCVGNRSEQMDCFSFERQLSFSMSVSNRPATFIVWASIAADSQPRDREKDIFISAADEIFPTIVQLALATGRGFRTEGAIQRFCQLVCCSQT